MLTTSEPITHHNVEEILGLQWQIEYLYDTNSPINYIVSRHQEKQHELHFTQREDEELMDAMAMLRLLARAKLAENYGTVFTLQRYQTLAKMRRVAIERQVEELTLAMKVVEIWDFDLIYRYWSDIIQNDHQWNIEYYLDLLEKSDVKGLTNCGAIWELAQNIALCERFNLPKWEYNPILEYIFVHRRIFYDCDARLTINDLIQCLIHLPELTDDSVSGLEELEKAVNQIIDIFAFTAKPKLIDDNGTGIWLLAN